MVSVHCFFNPNIARAYASDVRNVFAAITHGVPIKVWWHRNAALYAYVKGFVRDKKTDYVLVEHMLSTQFVPEEKTGVWIFSEHNVESKLFASFYRHEGLLFWRLLYWYESWSMHRYEHRMLRRFDRMLTISDVDARELRGMHSLSLPTITVPVLAPPLYPRGLSKAHTVVFIGSLEWNPNADGVTWFLQEVWPRVVDCIPDVNLIVIGKRGYNASLFPSTATNVQFVDEVNDIQSYMSLARVFVMPMRIGSGIRLKALTAMANSIPIVSTTIGASGLSVKDNVEMLIADDPCLFAQNVRELLSDNHVCRRLVNRAISYLRRTHSRKQFQHSLWRVMRSS